MSRHDPSRPKPPTLHDVAQRAGVSAMTASRALNGKPRVSAETREAVAAAVAELGYVPNTSARMLAGRTVRRIALLHGGATTSAYLGELLLGALDEAPARNVHLTVEQCPDRATMPELVAQIVEAHVAGVILPPPLCDRAELVEGLTAAGIAVVAIAPDRETEALASVSTDDRGAAYEMTRHLIELGHRRIALIEGTSRHRSSTRRRHGYVDALRDHDMALEQDLIEAGDFSYRSGLIAAERLLGRAERPTAIFACNDDMAAAAVTIAHQMKISVPGELSICGFDDTPLADAIWPRLTTIRQPIKEMSRKAMAILCTRLWPDGQDEASADPEHLRLPFELRRRQSDAVPPIGQ
ncbi:LacI family DNA-binding transcriptional regulator [Novosphingobium sp. TCA1]|uniref:LacI family DNA-binding transcriptional regulator n=1 Tax=Novosphingobium sp. TCA1 TaxID=2682474 RepID=UPI00135C80C7|nr:LacI family DNA-binding transcriptional regulator [Novosphingobium sp. TCA1]